MASYSAVIDLRVNGLGQFKTAEDSLASIQRLAKQINAVPALFDKRVGALDKKEKLNKAREDIEKLVKTFETTEKGSAKLSSTLAGVASQIKALGVVTANSTAGTDEFKNSIIAAQKASAKFTKIEAARLKVQSGIYQGTEGQQSSAVAEALALEKAVPKSIAGLELYKTNLREVQEQVKLGSNEFRALEDAIAKVDQTIENSRLAGQRSQIPKPQLAPRTDLGTVSAFKQRERFQQRQNTLLERQIGVERRIAQANLDKNDQAKVRIDLEKALQALINDDLTLAQQLTTEAEKQRVSLERAARARKQVKEPKGGVRRTGEFSPLTAPKRVQSIERSALLAQEKINTLAAKGVAVSRLQVDVQSLLSDIKDGNLKLELKSLNALDDRLTLLREEIKLEGQKLQTAKAQKKAGGGGSGDKKRNRVQQAAIGAAFPLLFGGGPLSVIGGGVGEFFGPLLGVVGSAIGGLLEEAAVKVSEFGSALNNPTENLEKLAKAAGLAGTAASRQIGLSQFLGAPEIGGRIAQNELTEIIGEGGVKGLKNLGTESTKLAGAFDILKTRVGSFFAPFLAGLAKATTFLLGGGSNAGDSIQREADLRQEISDIGNTTGRSGQGRRNKRRRLEKELEKVVEYNKKYQQSNEDINAIIEARLAPLQAASNLEEARLGLTREEIAAQEGQVSILNIQKTLTELITRQKQLDAGLEKDKLDILIRQTKEQERQAEAARANAIRMAQIQNQRDVSAQQQRATKAIQNSLDIQRDMEELTKSDAENYASRLETTERQLDAQVGLKLEQMRMVLLTVNEEDKRKAIRIATSQEINELRQKQLLTNEQIRQNEILRKDAAQAIVDARNLRRIQQEGSARRDISQADPSRAFAAAGQGIGFFEQSTLMNANLLQDRTLQLELYNAQIAQLEDRLSNLSSVDPEQVLNLQTQLKDLRATKESYEKLQPAIDAARVGQQRFNDAFAAISPAVNSLVNGFSEVIQGTKSAQQAFAEFLKTIGDTLVQEGSRMIATYIAIGIAKAFAGLSGGSSAPDPNSANVGSVLDQGGFTTGSLADSAASTPLAGLANGGPARAGQPYMVGERGPELFIPGTNGGVMRNDDMRQLMGRSPMGNTPQMNFSFETTNIGGQEFVSREQLEAAMATTRRQAANDGAKRGMNMTLDKMQNSPRTRSRVGIR